MKKRKIWTSLLLFIFLLSCVIPVHADTKEKKLYLNNKMEQWYGMLIKVQMETGFMSFTEHGSGRILS